MLHSTLSSGLSTGREIWCAGWYAPSFRSTKAGQYGLFICKCPDTQHGHYWEDYQFLWYQLLLQKKLRAQIQNNEFIKLLLNFNILPGIGIWHVHGHQATCFAQYAPLVIPGAGWVNSEIIETLWSNLNVVCGSTWEMLSLHNQELLEINDSNFVQMIRMSTYSPMQPVNDLS